MDYSYNNQYSTTSYGAQGGAGGGGFMADGGGSQDQGGRGGGGGGGRDYEKESLRPVTIKQLLDAEQLPNDFRIDNEDITQVTFVAQIRTISTQATNHTYKMDDGTGTIEVKVWIDPALNPNGEDGDSNKQKLVEGAYARVWGRLKAFGTQNKRHIGAHVSGIRPITDYNEIQYHLLEATVVHLHFTRGPPNTGQNGANTSNGLSHGMQIDGYGGGGGGAGSLPAGLSSGARKVYQILSTSPQNNEGLHMHDIANRAGMAVPDVQKAADELTTHSKIYSTVDDYTWAILDG